MRRNRGSEKVATLFFWEWLDNTFNELTLEETGRLFLELMKADRDGNTKTTDEVINSDRMLRACFNRMRADIFRNRVMYEETCLERRIAAYLKNNKGKTREDYFKEFPDDVPNSKCMQMQANATDNEYESVEEYESVKEYVDEPVSEIGTDTDYEKGTEKGKGCKGTNFGYFTEAEIRRLCVETKVDFDSLPEPVLRAVSYCHDEDKAKKVLLETRDKIRIFGGIK